METWEHTALGNLLRIDNIENNPYLRIDKNGILYLCLQRFDSDGLPTPMKLEMSAGEIIAMAGDYFTQANWIVDLYSPALQNFISNKAASNHLIDTEIGFKEEGAMIQAYNNLASPEVKRKHIDAIYHINNTEYFPSPTINQYIQQLMFYLSVKDYGEMLDRNLSHFTPWSVRVYMIGHSLALKCARLARELGLLAENPNYQSKNPGMLGLLELLKNHELYSHLDPFTLQDLMYRFHAQALCIELFTFHYYSDHYASGHMSMIGDLRKELTDRFGKWASILVNNMHNEFNTYGLLTNRIYNKIPDKEETPILAFGDGSYDLEANKLNKENCFAGMMASLKDIEKTLKTGELIAQEDFGGLFNLADVDYNYRQPLPLIVFVNNEIYHRKKIDEIRIISPSEHQRIRTDPLNNGYVKMNSTWDAFKLVAKLRALPFIYELNVKTLTAEEEKTIQLDEALHNEKMLPLEKAKSPGQLIIEKGFLSRSSRAKEPALASSTLNEVIISNL